MVIGAVGGEIRLRTKHFVHHIQAAHGEEITEKKLASFREQLWSGGEETVIPTVESGEGRGSLCCAALHSLRTGLQPGPQKGTPPPFPPPSTPSTPSMTPPPPPIRGQSSTSALMDFNYGRWTRSILKAVLTRKEKKRFVAIYKPFK